MTSPRPPRIVRALLALLLPRAERSHLLGEMDDLFARRAARDGRARATLWYARRAVGFPVRLGLRALVSRTGGAVDWLRGVARDATVASRVLRRKPVYAVATALTLGVGIGGGTTVYAAGNWVLFRPVPGVGDPGAVITVQMEVPDAGSPAFPVSQPDLESLRAGLASLGSLEAAVEADVHLRVGPEGEPRRLTAEAVTPGYFDLLRLAPARGRALGRIDADDPAVLVVSDRLAASAWPRGEAVGRSVRVNGHTFTVVGVLPAGFHGAELPGHTDLWTTPAALPRLRPDFPEDGLGRRGAGVWTDMLGRLRPGATVDAITTEGAAVIESAFADHQASSFFGPRFVIRGYPGIGPTPRYRAGIARTLTLLGVVAGLLVILAIANLANLALAHAASRRGVTTIQAALGAGRARIARRILVEHALLGLLGTAVGAGVAWAGVRAFRDARLVTNGGSLAGLEIDHRVAAFAFAVAMAASMATAILPVVHAASRDLLAGLRQSGSDRRTQRTQSALVVVQVAISTTLLVSAGLLTRSVVELRRVPLGFEPEGAVRFAIDPRTEGHEGEELRRIVVETAGSLSEVSGVSAAGFVSPSPIQTSYVTFGIQVAGGGEDDVVIGGHFQATSGALEAMGVRLLAGRLLDEADDRTSFDADPVPAVVSRVMVERGLPGIPIEASIGRLIERSYSSYPPIQIVGVIEDLRLVSLTDETPPIAFLPWGHGAPWGDAVGWVRSSRGSAALAAPIHAAVGRGAPGLPVYELRTARAQLDRLIVEERVLARLALTLGLAGLLLAGIGVHGVLGYGVTQRRKEIGIRAALGASRRGIVGGIVGRGLALTGIGIALGSGIAILVGRVMSARLFEVEALDPLTWAAGVLVLVLTAWIAAWGPARRATRIPPSEVLVAE